VAERMAKADIAEIAVVSVQVLFVFGRQLVDAAGALEPGKMEIRRR